ncbi:MAG TPA: LPS export ABC transporter permease LptF [Caulobacteraceae bacterium]|jgi:lipopolysaccharide export system permease protein
MQLIDRYLFRELLWPTLLATAALSGVAILSESLSTLDVIVDQRQSVFVFLKIILLAMPQLEVMILPVAVLVGALVALNRLHTEQEIVICFVGGMSRWRVIAPALTLASLAALASLLLTLWIQPLCYRELRRTLMDVRSDIAATLIRPGRFSHPAPGVTVFAQAMDDDGTIHNLFIDRALGTGRDSTVMAREGKLQKRAGAPMIVLRHGANQEFSKSGVLNYLSFDQYVLDLRPMMPPDRPVIYKLSDRYPHELFFPDLRGAWERANLGKLLAEGHARIADPLYSLAFMSLALAAVIGGSFSRMGYGQRIAAVAVAALVTRVLGFVVESASGSTPALNAAQYAIPIGVTVAALAALFVRRQRAKRRGSPILAGAPAQAVA